MRITQRAIFTLIIQCILMFGFRKKQKDLDNESMAWKIPFEELILESHPDCHKSFFGSRISKVSFYVKSKSFYNYVYR